MRLKSIELEQATVKLNAIEEKWIDNKINQPGVLNPYIQQNKGEST